MFVFEIGFICASREAMGGTVSKRKNPVAHVVVFAISIFLPDDGEPDS